MRSLKAGLYSDIAALVLSLADTSELLMSQLRVMSDDQVARERQRREAAATGLRPSAHGHSPDSKRRWWARWGKERTRDDDACARLLTGPLSEEASEVRVLLL